MNRPLPASRIAAVDLGVTQYDTGQTCVHGHRAPRWTVTGRCTECFRIDRQRYRKRVLDRYRKNRQQQTQTA